MWINLGNSAPAPILLSCDAEGVGRTPGYAKRTQSPGSRPLRGHPATTNSASYRVPKAHRRMVQAKPNRGLSRSTKGGNAKRTQSTLTPKRVRRSPPDCGQLRKTNPISRTPTPPSTCFNNQLGVVSSPREPGRRVQEPVLANVESNLRFAYGHPCKTNPISEGATIAKPSFNIHLWRIIPRRQDKEQSQSEPLPTAHARPSVTNA